MAVFGAACGLLPYSIAGPNLKNTRKQNKKQVAEELDRKEKQGDHSRGVTPNHTANNRPERPGLRYHKGPPFRKFYFSGSESVARGVKE